MLLERGIEGGLKGANMWSEHASAKVFNQPSTSSLSKSTSLHPNPSPPLDLDPIPLQCNGFISVVNAL